ncbi:MAG TPA: hypothetical protein VFU15_01730 [Bacteroidia bacterium]|nr:hypothetical protein [Bacteroidia bacterium]
MKKTLTLLFSCLSVAAFSQSYDKGAKVIETRFDIGTFHTQSHDKVNNTNSTGAAASKIISASFDYGVLPWLGAGIKFQYDNYFTSKDTITHTPPQADEIVKPSVHAFDPAVFADVHFLRRDHADLLIGGTIGPSFFSYHENDASDTRANGVGLWIDFHFTSRFYFGDHFGINLSAGYNSFNYPDMKAQSSTVPSIDSFSLKGSGGYFGLGLQYRFGD